jgi:hypothetical protein
MILCIDIILLNTYNICMVTERSILWPSGNYSYQREETNHPEKPLYIHWQDRALAEIQSARHLATSILKDSRHYEKRRNEGEATPSLREYMVDQFITPNDDSSYNSATKIAAVLSGTHPVFTDHVIIGATRLVIQTSLGHRYGEAVAEHWRHNLEQIDPDVRESVMRTVELSSKGKLVSVEPREKKTMQKVLAEADHIIHFESLFNSLAEMLNSTPGWENLYDCDMAEYLLRKWFKDEDHVKMYRREHPDEPDVAELFTMHIKHHKKYKLRD